MRAAPSNGLLFAWLPTGIEWATRVLSVVQASEAAAISVNRKRVDMPVIHHARRIAA